jgi:hypothetical protein
LRPDRIALSLLAAILALGLYALWPRAGMPERLASGAPAPMSGERPIPPPPPGVQLRAPSFDILRIEPNGFGAAQGRAEPLARVTLRTETGADLGSGAADDRGEWVIMMRTGLAPGGHVLHLIAEMPDGTGVSSAEDAVVALAERPEGRPLVVLMSPGEASRVLQSPQGPEARALSLEVMDQEAQGTTRFSGRADPGRSLYFYGDNHFLAQTSADDEGHWVLSFEPQRLNDALVLRIDVLGQDGVVRRRLQMSLQSEDGGARPAFPPARPGLIIADAGRGAWRIVRGDKRQPADWTMILSESTQKALDPAQSYPGQVPVAATVRPPDGIMPAVDR